MHVLMVRAGAEPVEENVGKNLGSMYKALDAETIQYVPLTDSPNGGGIGLICDEEGVLKDKPFNRDVAVVAREPMFKPDFVIKCDPGLCDPGEEGVHHMHGDFLFCRSDADGEWKSLSAEDVKRCREMLR